MKFSAQEEFGLRCLLSLAREGDDGFLTITQISDREGLTPSHVAKLLSILRQKGLVVSVRGQAGGYRLTRSAAEIPVSQALQALGGRLYDQRFCRRHAGLEATCVHDTDCQLRPLWAAVQVAVDRVLEPLMLQDLLDDKVEVPGIVLSARPRTGQALK